MGRFLDASTLREAVQQLGASRATPSVMDWLIFKRALVNSKAVDAKAKSVITGLQSLPFQQAIRELAESARAQSGTWNGPPFFSPFGYLRDKQTGFKSPRYPSNGPSDTYGGWQTRSAPPPPLESVPSTSPRQFRLAKRSPNELSEFLLKGGKEQKPTLLNAARWWFRATEFAQDPTSRNP